MISCRSDFFQRFEESKKPKVGDRVVPVPGSELSTSSNFTKGFVYEIDDYGAWVKWDETLGFGCRRKRSPIDQLQVIQRSVKADFLSHKFHKDNDPKHVQATLSFRFNCSSGCKVYEPYTFIRNNPFNMYNHTIDEFTPFIERVLKDLGFTGGFLGIGDSFQGLMFDCAEHRADGARNSEPTFEDVVKMVIDKLSEDKRFQNFRTWYPESCTSVNIYFDYYPFIRQADFFNRFTETHAPFKVELSFAYDFSKGGTSYLGPVFDDSQGAPPAAFFEFAKSIESIPRYNFMKGKSVIETLDIYESYLKENPRVEKYKSQVWPPLDHGDIEVWVKP